MSKKTTKKPAAADAAKTEDTQETVALPIDLVIPYARAHAVVSGTATTFFAQKKAGAVGTAIVIAAESENQSEVLGTAKLTKLQAVKLDQGGVTILNSETGLAPFRPNSADGFAKLNGHENWAAMRYALEEAEYDLAAGVEGYWHHWDQFTVSAA